MSPINAQIGVAEPVYVRVSRLLEREVRAGYRPGDRLPSEGQLAARFGINRHTLRRAVEILVDAGLLLRQRGLGTIVAEPPISYSVGQRTRLTETLETQGRVAASRVLHKQVVRAVGGVAARLGLEEGEDVLWVETLRMADDRPICLISHFLPLAAFSAVLREYEQGSLHQFLEQAYGFTPRRSFSLVAAVVPESTDLPLLRMAPGQPVLRVKSVNVHPQSDAPVEYAVTRFRADMVQVRIEPTQPN